MKVAVLGASGYIGRSLIHEYQQNNIEVIPVVRDFSEAETVFTDHNIALISNPIDYEDLFKESFDIVINAAGIGSPSRLRQNQTAIFAVTEELDEIIFNYLTKYPNALVFNLSSGAVFGHAVGNKITDKTEAIFDPANIIPADYYGLTKLLSEAKHRSTPDLSIIDLRVYSFFSAFVDTADTFLLSEIVRSIKKGTILETGATDIVRDFINAEILVQVIKFISTVAPTNAVYDLGSQEPITKFALLDQLKEKYGLQYVVTGDLVTSATGEKNTYCADTTALRNLGFVSPYTSLEVIEKEMEKFFRLNS